MAILSLNEIKRRANTFSVEWKDESRERAEKDTFWNEFLNIFGVHRRRVSSFEKSVKKLSGNNGFIDLFWPGKLIVEHKSRGLNLDKAFDQAVEYFYGLSDKELPQYILVSDFQSFVLHDLDSKTRHAFKIDELSTKIHLFGFISGYEKREFRDEDPVNIDAAYKMGLLHDKFKSIGYEGHVLEVYLVRLLFCLFADDTGIFEKDSFLDFVSKSKVDGTDLASRIGEFFQILDTPKEKRFSNIDETLNDFPYVNGDLFKEVLPISSFDTEMRLLLLDACELDWGAISPAIFGSMFQAAMNPKDRRDLGAHYTSEINIMKVIKSVFLDDLYLEFEKAKKSQPKLREFHVRLSKLKFFDPACGSGNFLIISYRCIRELEIEILKELIFNKMKIRREVMSSSGIRIDQLIKVSVGQFYGIEYDEFASRIGEVAMWLIDHQMNNKVSQIFGEYFARLPLKESATILNENSLRVDWSSLLNKGEIYDYIIGNPPFYGKHKQTKDQKSDIQYVFNGLKNSSDLDYVSGWFYKASEYIKGKDTRVGFVTTNSITQGEQVPLLWPTLIHVHEVQIFFAHRTFKWKNKAKDNAAVHVVIIGLTNKKIKDLYLYDYEKVTSDPVQVKVKRINPYLVDSEDIIVDKSRKPISARPRMVNGNKPVDDGNFLFLRQEMIDFIEKEPSSHTYFKKFIGAREFISNKPRFCLWLKDISPSELKSMPTVLERVKNVKIYRSDSTSKSTKAAADKPTEFFYISFTGKPYLVIPETSSIRREYIPIGYALSDTVASNKLYTVVNADLYIFALLTSRMHMVWVRTIGGRMKSDYSYSGSMVYTTFPFPEEPNGKKRAKIENCANRIIEIREKYFSENLETLYDPDTMPYDLIKAHKSLDKVVESCYRSNEFVNDSARIDFLLHQYKNIIHPIL